eukprot:720706-Prorocentrum_minimum.AAC.4
MDINAMMAQVVEQQVMNVASVVEDQLDDQLHKLENLDEDDLERIRQKRIQAMKAAQVKKQKWMALGHGEVKDLQNEKVRGCERAGQVERPPAAACVKYRLRVQAVSPKK